MKTAKISNWTLKKGESAFLYWISSPKTNENGSRMVTTYFQKENKKFVSFDVSWGDLPLLLMGYYYMDGKIAGISNALQEFEITSESITSQRISNARNAIPLELYSLQAAKISFEEKCLVLYTDKMKYIIPCIELIRAIYGVTPFYLETLLSTEGLESFARYTKHSQKDLDVRFFENFPVEIFVNNTLLEEFVFLTQTQEIREWREFVYSQFRPGEKIQANFPKLQGITMHGYGMRYKNNTVLLLNIRFNNVSFPFEEVSFEHPDYREGIQVSSLNKNRYILDPNSSNEDIPLSGEALTSKNQRAQIVEGPNTAKQFRNSMKIKRKKAEGEKHNSKKIFIEKKQEELFSTQVRTNGGKAQPIEIQPQAVGENIKPEEGFEDFCKVMQRIQQFSNVTDFKIGFEDLPRNLSILDMPTGKKRKYAVVSFMFNGKEIGILEICNVEFSIATMIFFAKDIKKAVLIAMDILRNSNGHWCKELIKKAEKESGDIKFSTLKHFKNRTVEKWVELVCKIVISI